MTRRLTKTIKAGAVCIGGNSPISVQTMTNTDTSNTAATLAQVRAMQEAGADIVRLAVPDEAAAATFTYLKEQGITVPLVADIHFDYRIALAAVAAGADKIRINPGNIGSREKVEAVVRACRAAGVPIRIGVNSGSLEKHILEKHGAPTAEALAESALYHAAMLEALDFEDIVLSVKASTVPEMIEANRILAERTSYPLHLGVTEAGGAHMGVVKSAVGIGACLADGIGDTIRVSLTADPLLEIREARAILSALGMNPVREMDIISCPTCGRTKIDLIPLLSRFEEELDKTGLRRLPLRVAFMGCVVNGPGEAREADIGIAGGIGEGILFKKGEIIRRVPEDAIVPELIAEIRRMTHAE
ncbi:MAG: flavodoxin-dependent (E)-4-hydroxy-3-methylbut-2-enyl-diphosphate synthase [Clostridia bacterium]|nr:flavodoxin-dependent (E)-4-hydroxy-3-methylbut-2-enyl-diphosphate synthase [Clostridia bacterium]